MVARSRESNCPIPLSGSWFSNDRRLRRTNGSWRAYHDCSGVSVSRRDASHSENRLPHSATSENLPRLCARQQNPVADGRDVATLPRGRGETTHRLRLGGILRGSKFGAQAPRRRIIHELLQRPCSSRRRLLTRTDILLVKRGLPVAPAVELIFDSNDDRR